MQPGHPTGDQFIDVSALIRASWRGKWVVLGCCAVGMAIASTYLVFATPTYRSTVVMVSSGTASSMGGSLGSTLSQLGGIASLAGINLNGGNDGTEEAIAVLKSRGFTESFVKDEMLMPTLFAADWDSSRATWKQDISRPPTYEKAYLLFDKKVRSVEEDKKTNLITLTVEWSDRELAAVWANKLIDRLNAVMRTRAIGAADASVGYLEHELVETRDVETRDAISKLLENQVKQRMLANVTPEYAFRIVDRAMPSDADNPVWPRRVLVIIGGILVGFALGCAIAVRVFGKNPPSTVALSGVQ